MRDFTVEFLKCFKIHGHFTEGVTNDAKLSIANNIISNSEADAS